MVLSTLHQCFKYGGEDLKVHTHFTYKNPFQAIESHHVDADLYKAENERKDEEMKNVPPSKDKKIALDI